MTADRNGRRKSRKGRIRPFLNWFNFSGFRAPAGARIPESLA